jgi:hypothetical protein
MIADRRKHVFLALACGVAGAWQPASAAEFECRHGDVLRRVEVAIGEAAGDAACEVRYWRNASIPGEVQVLWRASQDLDFCDAKARDLLARLEAGGWACSALELPREPEATPRAAARAAPEGTPARAAADLPSPQASEPDAATAARPATADLTTAKPAALSAVAAGQEPPAPGAAPPAPAPATVAPAPPAIARAEPSAPVGALTGLPADAPHAALLEQVVGQTLHSVQEMYGGDFRAEDAAFGDLDGDGRDDAAVLVTYQTEREDYVQYLVAYLFDGQTFQSTATKNVGGRFLDALRADVRGIVDRAIVVDLQALDAGEICCETRTAAYVLKEGQLVEVADPPALGGRT